MYFIARYMTPMGLRERLIEASGWDDAWERANGLEVFGLIDLLSILCPNNQDCGHGTDDGANDGRDKPERRVSEHVRPDVVPPCENCELARHLEGLRPVSPEEGHLIYVLTHGYDGQVRKEPEHGKLVKRVFGRLFGYSLQ